MQETYKNFCRFFSCLPFALVLGFVQVAAAFASSALFRRRMPRGIGGAESTRRRESRPDRPQPDREPWMRKRIALKCHSICLYSAKAFGAPSPHHEPDHQAKYTE